MTVLRESASSCTTRSCIAPTCGRPIGSSRKALRIERVVLEHDLKRDYQVFLQEPNRGRADSDGRPGRDREEIRRWADDHDLAVRRWPGAVSGLPDRVSVARRAARDRERRGAHAALPGRSRGQ